MTTVTLTDGTVQRVLLSQSTCRFVGEFVGSTMMIDRLHNGALARAPKLTFATAREFAMALEVHENMNRQAVEKFWKIKQQRKS